MQDLFLNDRFRVYSSSDVVGVGAGRRPEKCHGPVHRLLHRHGLWDNTKAMLMTRGLAETARLGGGPGGGGRPSPAWRGWGT